MTDRLELGHRDLAVTLNPTEYLRFEELPNPRKRTRLITVWSVKHGYDLGTIRWYGRWRQYVFEPARGTIFNSSCTRDLAIVLAGLNMRHHEAKP